MWVKCLRCGENEAISETQWICTDCLLKVTPKIEWRDTRSENLRMSRVRLTLVENHGDIKVYEPTDNALSGRGQC